MQYKINRIPPNTKSSMVHKGVWKEGCPVSMDRLKLVEVQYYNFQDQISSGQLVVLDGLAQSVCNIFRELFDIKFPIYSMLLMDEFDGDDDISMNANNSSAFNFRTIMGTKKLSMHAYGAAIDINPMQNPHLAVKNTHLPEKNREIEILPKQGVNFLRRDRGNKGMVEPIVYIFQKYGFTDWGGLWASPVDYQHFQITREALDIKLAEEAED